MSDTEPGRKSGVPRLAGTLRQTELGFVAAVILIGATTALLVVGGHLVPFYDVILALFLGAAGIASVLTAVWLRHTQRDLREANKKLGQRIDMQTVELEEATVGLGDEARQRHVVEGALRESEENFRLLVDQMNDGFAIQDEAGVITYANDKLHEILGYAPGELSGRSAVELIHERSLAEYRQRNAERREGEGGSYELELATKQGGSLTAIISGQPLFDADGKVRGSFGVVTDITERKAAEDALRESDERFQALFNRSLDAVYIHDFDGKFIDANDAALQMLGYTRDDNPSLSFMDLLDDAQIPIAMATLDEIVRTGSQATPTVYQLLRKDGSRVEVETIGALLMKEGQPIGVQGIARDLTERKRAEDALRESEHRYRTLVERLHDGVAIQDEAGMITYASERLCEMLEYPAEELVGRPGSQISQENSLEEFQGRASRLRQGDSTSDEVVLKTKSGRRIDVLISAQPTFAEDGTFRGAVAVLTDITERKQAEGALRESEHQYRTLVERLNDGVAVQDEAGMITYASERLCEMLEYTTEELVGQPVSQLIHQNSLETFQQRTGRLREGESTSDELELKTKSGRSIFVLASAQPRFDEDGTYRGASAVLTDISERKQIEDALRESEQRFRSLVEGMNEGLAIRDNENVMTYVNDTLCKMLAYEPGELTGRPAAQIIHEDSRTTFRENIADRDKGGSGSYELNLVTKHGDRVPVIVGPRPLYTAAGEINGSFAVITDISELKRVEEALRLQSEILQNVTEAVFLIRASDGVIVYTNPSFERLFGYGPAEMFGKHVSLVNASSDKSPEETANEIIAALNRAGVWRGEIQNVKKDGTSFWCQANVSTFDHPEHGSVWVSVHTDITERKAAEEALRESEVRYRGLFDAAFDAIVVHDDGVILDANPAFEKMAGRPLAELIGTYLPDLAREDGREALKEKLNSAPGDPYEAVGEKMTGGPLYLEAVTREHTYRGQAVRVTAMRDITARKEAEAALQSARDELEGKVERTMVQRNMYGLTFREFTVLHHLAAGKADKEIAAELVISPLTVHKHVANILAKMNASSRTEAGVRALRDGLLD